MNEQPPLVPVAIGFPEMMLLGSSTLASTSSIARVEMRLAVPAPAP
jgi:hypothetical protein